MRKEQRRLRSMTTVTRLHSLRRIHIFILEPPVREILGEVTLSPICIVLKSRFGPIQKNWLEGFFRLRSRGKYVLNLRATVLAIGITDNAFARPAADCGNFISTIGWIRPTVRYGSQMNMNGSSS